jgi:soluble lytic murein transglycosylase
MRSQATSLLFFMFLIGLFPQISLGFSDALKIRDLTQHNRSELIVYEDFTQFFKSYQIKNPSPTEVKKLLARVSKSEDLLIVKNWLAHLNHLSSLSGTDLMQECHKFKSQTLEQFGIEKRLTLNLLFRCRRMALQFLSFNALQSKKFDSQGLSFLTKYLYAFVYGQNQNDFIKFAQSLESDPILQESLSLILSDYLLKQTKPVHPDLLTALNLSAQVTRHIQALGIDYIQHEVFFTQRFSRWIEEIYKSFDLEKGQISAEKSRELLKWVEASKTYTLNEVTLTRLGDLAKNLWRYQFPNESEEIFNFIIQNGSPEQKEDAWFFLLWSHLYKGNYESARDWIMKEKLLEQIEDLQEARLKYWVLDVMKGKKTTKLDGDLSDHYQELIYEHPLSFYSIYADKILRAADTDYVSYYAKLPTLGPHNQDLVSLNPEMIRSLKRLRIWAKLDAKKFLQSEVKFLQKHHLPILLKKASGKEEELYRENFWLLLSQFVHLEENYLESFKILYYALDENFIRFSKDVVQLLYPRLYFEKITKHTQDTDINPFVVVSLIRQESVFNNRAQSPVGALGLMQLMPQTARRFNRRVRNAQLMQPDLNLEIGIKYFRQLTKRYSAIIPHVLSAYNAGEGRIDRWKSLYLTQDDFLHTTETIPFLETRNYVKLITRNIFFYKLLSEDFKVTDSPLPHQIYDIVLYPQD